MRYVRILTALLVAQLACHLFACDTPAPAPDAPLPSCASLGCTFVLCSSHDGPCLCHDQSCAPDPTLTRDDELRREVERLRAALEAIYDANNPKRTPVNAAEIARCALGYP